MGYFNHPRDANATAVAEDLDISPATFAEHLALAQSKLLDSILES
jgi:predicted DNA binding protein